MILLELSLDRVLQTEEKGRVKDNKDIGKEKVIFWLYVDIIKDRNSKTMIVCYQP